MLLSHAVGLTYLLNKQKKNKQKILKVHNLSQLNSIAMCVHFSTVLCVCVSSFFYPLRQNSISLRRKVVFILSYLVIISRHNNCRTNLRQILMPWIESKQTKLMQRAREQFDGVLHLHVTIHYLGI